MKKQIIGTILFLAIGILLYIGVSKVFVVSNKYSEHAEMMLNGYYDEKKDTVDAVFIGNSHIYRYWQSPYAWEQYGIASLPLSTSDMPYSIMNNMVIEAYKYQKPKVLVLDATVFATDEKEPSNKVYLVLNNMKKSINYYSTINSFCNNFDIKGTDRLQYLFPVVQFHSRWKDLNKNDFNQEYPSYLNGCYLDKFLTSTIKKREHKYTVNRIPIGEKQEESLRKLLTWCKKENIKVEFLSVPLLRGEEKQGMINYTRDIVQEYGFDFVDCNEDNWYQSFGFVEDKDFQDINHTNVNGSYKFVNVYGDYLKNKYELPDHRQDPSYSSWQERTNKYFEIIKDYLYVNK